MIYFQLQQFQIYYETDANAKLKIIDFGFCLYNSTIYVNIKFAFRLSLYSFLRQT